MHYKHTILHVFLMFFTITHINAQDPVFSQFYAAPLQLNPALTGLVDAPVFTLNYRNQWAGVPNAYTTYAATYSQYAPRLNSGFGMSVMADVAGNGIYNTYQVGAHYAYDIRFSDDFYMRMGMEAAWVGKRLDWSQLIFLDQIDPLTGAFDQDGNPNPTQEQAPAQNVNYLDLGVGALLHTKHFYVGFAAKHLTAPDESFWPRENFLGELPIRFTVHAGAEIPLNKDNKYKKTTFLSPSILFAKQRQFHQLNLGAYLRYNIILGGIWFRHTFTNADAVIMMVGFQKGPIKVAYSYDLTVSRLGMQAGGAHEVSLMFNLGDPNRKRQQRYNDCMQLFR